MNRHCNTRGDAIARAEKKNAILCDGATVDGLVETIRFYYLLSLIPYITFGEVKLSFDTDFDATCFLWLGVIE
jgi:hypothetical protein